MPSRPIELPAAVEVATYRIVTEAVTNVVRHAHAAQCWLTISTGPTVDIDVVDDGIGIADGERHGVGLDGDAASGPPSSAAACRSLPNRPHGTHIHVRLPAALP